MSLRTVRLDEVTEKLLEKIIQKTGLSITGAIKMGIAELHEEVIKKPKETAYEIFKKIELHDDCNDLPPASEAKKVVREIIRKKYEDRGHGTS